jgi:hypothetical protein
MAKSWPTASMELSRNTRSTLKSIRDCRTSASPEMNHGLALSFAGRTSAKM